MRKNLSEKAQTEPPLLQSAPPTLVGLYNQRSRFPGRAILHRLLTDSRMKQPWAVLNRHVTSDRGWERLWREVTFSLRHARKEPVRRTDEKAQFLKIAKKAETLAKAVEGDRLDLRAYELFPDDVMEILGVSNWTSLNALQRANVANKILHEWPTVPELLSELATRARRLANEAMTKTRVVERTTRDREALYFVRALGSYVKGAYGRPLYGTVAVIASVVLERPVEKRFVEKEMNRT